MSESSTRQRVGILGGTFDPIHVGHLILAEYCREHLRLDQVRFIPAAISPLKIGQEPVPPKVRLEMVKLAISGNPHFAVDDREVRRGGTSYTVDTLGELAAEMPDSSLVFLMGADSLADLDKWREPAEICRLAEIAVVRRGGQPMPDVAKLASYLPNSAGDASECVVDMPQVEISSSDIRSRVASGRSLRYLLHPTTAALIASGELYKS
ncbi:MAG: nicotinate (nicotinamide) nucleotide adenylyltransferase [Aureliella sp.]